MLPSSNEDREDDILKLRGLPDDAVLRQRMAYQHSPRLHMQHLKRYVLRIPPRRVTVTHRHHLRLGPIISNEGHHVSPRPFERVTEISQVCVRLWVTVHRLRIPNLFRRPCHNVPLERPLRHSPILQNRLACTPLFVPSSDMAKSIMDSREVAQSFSSDLRAGASHCWRVFCMRRAILELGLMEKPERGLGRSAVEKGMDLALLWGRNDAESVILLVS
ncbi:hypothetical protein QJS10_CPB17g00450 [Acorus calamus]|uniref:Uncharacterized protein n=1 Tax=Acorus calamus TaxID=4465 RepID=A0AAV9CWA7_ACOCL|nr:hypothetical protein QJS10_CPB17g00450 [Acorus calamus]